LFAYLREEEADRRSHGGLQLLTGSRVAALSSALWDSDRAQRNGMELCQGRGSWGSGTGSAPEVGGHGTGCPGQWAQP